MGDPTDEMDLDDSVRAENRRTLLESIAGPAAEGVGQALEGCESCCLDSVEDRRRVIAALVERSGKLHHYVSRSVIRSIANMAEVHPSAVSVAFSCFSSPSAPFGNEEWSWLVKIDITGIRTLRNQRKDRRVTATGVNTNLVDAVDEALGDVHYWRLLDRRVREPRKSKKGGTR